MTKVIVSDKALREMVAEVLDNTGWSGEENSPAVVINPVTDPSVAVTDPINPNFTPQTKTEFGVAMNRLVKNLPDSEMPSIYSTVKKAMDQRSEKDEMDAAESAAMAGGSQEAIDANMGKGTEHKQEGKTMSTAKKLEEQLRARIRSTILEILSEAKPFDWKNAPAPTGSLPPVKKIPAGEHGGEYSRRQEKTKSDLRKSLGHAVDKLENEPEPPEEEEAPEAETGEEEAGEEPTKKRAYKPTAIGGVSDVQGKSFEEIANELKFSVAGAKQAVDKAVLRFGFLYKLPEDEREIMVLTAMNAYIEMLNKTGELTPADIQLMKDHPDIVRELDGFREYLHNTIRRSMKGNQKVIDPLGRTKPGEEEDDSEPNLPDDEEEEAPGAEAGAPGEAPPAAPAAAPEAPRAGGKATYKVYGKLKGAPAHTRLKGKAYLAPGDTQFSPGEQAKVEPNDGKLKVTKTDSDHSQTWEPESEELPEADDPAQIKGNSVANSGAPKSSSPPKDAPAKMASGKTASVDWGSFGEGKRIDDPLLSEAVTMVMQDRRGPYVIADGVEARPTNPNRTQYRAGTRVNVHRHGKKGVFIVEMPNGERWSNKLQEMVTEASHGSVAGGVAARKRKFPELFCPKCLWMTGGGPCPRHGGGPWTPERQEAARAKARETYAAAKSAAAEQDEFE